MNSLSSTTSIGRWGEDLAVQALQTHGYKIVERNWRCLGGEIDIVAQDGEVWVFVEVKLRGSTKFGTPEESVNSRKQARLLQLGVMYMKEIEQLDAFWRIDVVAIDLTSARKVKRIEIHRDAVRSDT